MPHVTSSKPLDHVQKNEIGNGEFVKVIGRWRFRLGAGHRDLEIVGAHCHGVISHSVAEVLSPQALDFFPALAMRKIFRRILLLQFWSGAFFVEDMA